MNLVRQEAVSWMMMVVMMVRIKYRWSSRRSAGCPYSDTDGYRMRQATRGTDAGLLNSGLYGWDVSARRDGIPNGGLVIQDRDAYQSLGSMDHAVCLELSSQLSLPFVSSILEPYLHLCLRQP